MAVRILAVLAILAGLARAQQPSPPWQPADVLREGNTAATAGDWLRVSQLVDPLVRAQLPAADLAEAHRLAGLAAFFQGRKLDAETHFLAYLKIDLDATLDPNLYPPEALTFFAQVKAKYRAELAARRPKRKRYWFVSLLPPFAQVQNGEPTKAWIIGGALGGFLVANITSAIVLSRRCDQVSDVGGRSQVCDNFASADTWRIINGVGGVAAILTYAYGVYDGVKTYRRRSREVQPFVSTTKMGDTLFGVAGEF